MKKLKLRGIVAVTALTIILTGCQIKEETQINNTPNNSSIDQVEVITPEQNEYIEEPTYQEDYGFVEQESIEETIPSAQNFTFF
jgi:hypothetical protein